VSELLALIGLVAQGGAWLRRWLRITEPYHQAKLEAAVAEMAADTQRRVAEQLPRPPATRLYGEHR
jgi:hypothetical protein